MERLLGSSNWMEELKSVMPFMGHRNWLLIVDKAFPAQSASGMKYIDTRQELLPTLKDVLNEISENAPHIKPIIYTDLELRYMSNDLCADIKDLRDNINDAIKNFDVKTLLHEDVFSKLSEASKLFEVIVLKTETTKPYTSVFIEFDCGYWSAERENQLRKKMEID